MPFTSLTQQLRPRVVGAPPSPPPLPNHLPTAAKLADPPLHSFLAGQMIKEPGAGYSEIWLCCERSRLFKGHWVIFIPSKARDGCGTAIHVEGTVKEGFQHGFKRLSCPPWLSDQKPVRLHLGNIKDAWIIPEAEYPADETTVDIIPTNRLEKLALSVPAPGPSLNSANAAAVSRSNDA